MRMVDRVKLSEISELITKGTTPTTIGYDFQDKGINFLKIECFDENGNYKESKTAYISEECHNKLKRSQLKEGDILFSIAGVIGRVAMVTKEMIPANTNQAFAIIRINNGSVYLPYIKLILASPIVRDQFERKKQGVAQLNISLKDIKEIEIPLPNKKQQIEMVDLFAKITSIITCRNIELSFLDELIKARFVEMFGAITERKRLEQYTTLITKGASPKWQGIDYCDEGTLFVTSENVREGHVDLTKRKYLPNKINDILPRSVLQINDILINIVGASIGRAAVFDSAELANINQAVALVRLKEGGVNQRFLITFLNSEEALKAYGSMKKGGARDNLSLKNIADLMIPVATEREQEQFASFAIQVDKSKVAIQQSLDKTKELFNSLMQQYFQ